MIEEKLLKNEEKAIFTLRSLYRKYGYLPFKMSKFEEYDLYVRNKDFLVSDRVITFNDTNGRLLALKPDGVMLSNGPGDPAENTGCIAQIAKLIGKLPVFGICLGHQLTALAMGGKTEKLHYGHRGTNQPVRQVGGNRTYITSQNHGYAVVSESLAGVGRQIFVNANDGSCEGMEYPGLQCFTVQFHPEASAGPHDTSFLFDRFIRMMEEK